MEKIVIKNVEKPTDIIIYGSCIESNNRHDFSITDDESSYSIYIDGKEFEDYCSSIGFVTVLSLQEYIDEIKENFYDEEDGYKYAFSGPVDSFLLKNYIGEISIKILNGDKYLNLDEVDLSDYLYHQNGNFDLEDEDDDDFDVCLELNSCVPIIIDEEFFNSMLKMDKRKSILEETKKWK